MQDFPNTQKATRSPVVTPRAQPPGSKTTAGNRTTAQLASLSTAVVNQKLKAELNSLPSCVLKIQAIPVISEAHGFLGTREIPSLSTTNPLCLKDFSAELRDLCRPCAPELIARELYGMTLVMARRKEEDLDFKSMIAVFKADLSEYPEDVIVAVCHEFRKTQKFFPTLSDLRAACEDRFEFRRALLAQIDAIGAGHAALAAPAPSDPRAALSHRELDREEWLPCHWAEFCAEAHRMSALWEQNGDTERSASWKAEAERRTALWTPEFGGQGASDGAGG